MRYTTLIDISQAPQLYRNINVRLIYLHLVLKAGYHSHDRDIVPTSIRRLAADTGLTESAVRHALKQLTTFGLFAQKDGKYYVRKWCEQQDFAERPKTKKAQKELEREMERQRVSIQREAELAARDEFRAKLEQENTTSYELYITTLKQRAAQGDEEAIKSLKLKGILL